MKFDRDFPSANWFSAKLLFRNSAFEDHDDYILSRRGDLILSAKLDAVLLKVSSFTNFRYDLIFSVKLMPALSLHNHRCSLVRN